MKTQLVFRILSAILMVFVTLAVASPAFADTLVRTVIVEEKTTVWSGDDNPCGFDLAFHDYGKLQVNWWLDENGVTTHSIVIYGNRKEEVTANGKSANVQFQGPVLTTYIENGVINKTVGANSIITVPGYGKIFGGAGQILETILVDPVTGEVSYTLDRQVGNIAFDFGPLCEYLGPG